MQQKTLLITGGAGYIGSHTSWLLAQKGYRIIILDHTPPPRALQGQVTYIQDDFASTATLHNLFTSYHIEAVIHFAAYIDVHASLTNPRQYYQNNVIKTCRLLDAMIEYGVQKCIFSSSCAMYGNPQYTPIDEQHPQCPITPYGASKQMVEQILHDYTHAYNFNYISLRYFNAAGAQPEQHLGEQHLPETHLIPLVCQALQNQTPFKIFGNNHPTRDGTCIRDFLHVQDIAWAHYLALMYINNNASNYFNLGTGRGTSVLEVVQAAEQIYKKKLPIIYENAREGDPAILVANSTKARMLLGWYPHYSDIKHIIRSANDYLRQQEGILQA